MGNQKKEVGTIINQKLKMKNQKHKSKIVILHGWAYSTERWKPFIEELEKGNIVSDILKIPGLTAPLNEVWNIDNYVDWLDEILMKDSTERSGQGKVILLGHSNGGLISLAYTLKYPEKVKQLILIDSSGIYHKEFFIRLKRFVFASAAKMGKKFTSSPVMKKLLYKLARAHDYESATPVMKETMKNLIRTDYSQFLKNLRIPTIIIWGGRDQVTPVADGKKMNEKIIGSSLHIISGARHSPQLTHSEEVADIIMKNI